MKPSLIFYFLFICNFVICQDTIYLDKEKNVISDRLEAKYFQTVEYDSVVLNKAIEKRFYISGKIQCSKQYVNYGDKILDGTSSEWFENGQLSKEVEYKDGSLNGTLSIFLEDGILRKLEYYKNNKLLEGYLYNREGIKIDSTKIQTMPIFPGGQEAPKNYLAKKIIYPENCIKNKISGTAVVSFVVEKNGKISNAFIIKSSESNALDMEALRVVLNMPNWEPGMNGKNPVKVNFMLPIKFSFN